MSRWRTHRGLFMNWHSSLMPSVLRLLLDRHRWVKVRLPERAETRLWQLTRLSSQLFSLQGEPPRGNNEARSSGFLPTFTPSFTTALPRTPSYGANYSVQRQSS